MNEVQLQWSLRNSNLYNSNVTSITSFLPWTPSVPLISKLHYCIRVDVIGGGGRGQKITSIGRYL